MNGKKILGIAASALIVMFTGCTTSDGFAFLGSVASAVGDDSTAAAFNSISKATEEITPENEYYIGRSVAANLLTNYKTYSSPRLEAYLNKICQVLVMNSDNPDSYNGYHVKILDSSEVNAFSTSGGHILITTGLIECAKSEDGLAAVVAHEIGHIHLKHSFVKGSNAKPVPQVHFGTQGYRKRSYGDGTGRNGRRRYGKHVQERILTDPGIRRRRDGP